MSQPDRWRECVVCGLKWYRRAPQVNCPRRHQIDAAWLDWLQQQFDSLDWLQQQFDSRGAVGSYARGQRFMLRQVAQRLEVGR
jgi:hypothetical protein